MRRLFQKIAGYRGDGSASFTIYPAKEPHLFCDTAKLGAYDQMWLKATFGCQSIDEDWFADARKIAALNIPDMAGGVNPGDRRALYYLVRRLKPVRFLEIGTHIGSSTVALALAAARNQTDGVDTRIVTIDIRDVNSESLKPWAEAGSPAPPCAFLTSLGLNHLVAFEVNTAVDKLASSADLFDVIFLDGDHSAEAVCNEIPLALNRLRANGRGTIVLHDYFPDLQPLWPGQDPLSGPFRAVEWLLAAGAELQVVPLGALPWPTKLGSNITSLAILSVPP